MIEPKPALLARSQPLHSPGLLARNAKGGSGREWGLQAGRSVFLQKIEELCDFLCSKTHPVPLSSVVLSLVGGN